MTSGGWIDKQQKKRNRSVIQERPDPGKSEEEYTEEEALAFAFAPTASIIAGGGGGEFGHIKRKEKISELQERPSNDVQHQQQAAIVSCIESSVHHDQCEPLLTGSS